MIDQNLARLAVARYRADAIDPGMALDVLDVEHHGDLVRVIGTDGAPLALYRIVRPAGRVHLATWHREAA